MKNKLMTVVLMLMLSVIPLMGQQDEIYFNKGVLYLLADDYEQARSNFGAYFQNHPVPAIKNGFALLTDKKYEEATRQFSDYLDMNHRSTHAIVGIGISTSHSSFSNAPEVFKRAALLDSSFSTAYLGLGVEFVKQKDYPKAIKYFQDAYRARPVADYKILPARLYMEMGQYRQVLDLLKGEADRTPDNFYFNFLTAQAYMHLNQFAEMARYREAAQELRPDDRPLKILTARYYLGQNNPSRAAVTLRGLTVEGTDDEYNKAYAHALVKQKDNQARKYLADVFSRQKWDKEINYLLGLHSLWKVQEAGLQNWIYRSILSGGDPKELMQVFPAKYLFPEFPFFNFFEVKAVVWLTEKYVMAIAIQNSGEPEKVYIFDAAARRLVQTTPIVGQFQKIFSSPARNRYIFTTMAQENRSVYAYGAEFIESAPGPRIWPLSGERLEFPVASAAFNNSGSLVYLTDERASLYGFDSPFAETDELGGKKFLYHNYPYRIYKYNFATREMLSVPKGDIAQLEASPMPLLKMYAMFSTAALNHPKIQELMDKGKEFDSSSSEFVKVVFSNDLDAFVIYLADLVNPFKGVVYDGRKNIIHPVDQEMFMGGPKNFSDLDVVDLNIKKSELIVLTRKTKELILYNFRDFWSIRLAQSVDSVSCDRKNRVLHILTRSNSKIFFSGASLQKVSLEPYLNKSYNTDNQGLDKLERYVDETELYFSTTTGELIRMDQGQKFNYIRPSFEGCIHDVSPSGKVVAAYINKRLYLADFTALRNPAPGPKAGKGK